MIQHDCGHGSFFRRRRANDWLGRALGVLTLTPYGYRRRTHAMHHATSGHLGRRGTGDVATLTVREYQSTPAWRRGLYRLMPPDRRARRWTVHSSCSSTACR